jgi:2-C-methyl-D-erythritol 2,4-cyclodiphosphate synthase
VDGRPLVVGGVEIPSPRGLLGHSDADVLIHAVCDAVLGALGLGDIGKHFPDTDERFRGISSLVLLERVQAMASQRGFRCGNLDAVIIAQQPKMSPYIDRMRAAIARGLNVSPEAVSIKATTTEGLGFEGRAEGIAAQAVVLMVAEIEER